MASEKLYPKSVKLSSIAEDDLFGIYFLHKGTKQPLYGYYESLNEVRPLLVSEPWNVYTTGFYINIAPKDPSVSSGNWLDT